MGARPGRGAVLEASEAHVEQAVGAVDESDIDCYCGLGPACHLYRTMTPEERDACTRDKRQTAQWLFMNGLQNR